MSQPLIARATAEDVPELLSVDTEAFDGPLSATMFPRTPGVRQWREDKLLGWINDPNMAVLKVMGNDGEVAAFARWSKPKTHPDGKEASKTPDIPTDWPCDANTELLQRFFGTLGARRTENMGEVPHWYLVLLATRPAYQGRGYGRALLQWGLDKADEDGRDAYLEASKSGLPLYKKNGFSEMGDIDIDVPTGDDNIEHIRIVCMLRKPRQTAS